MPPRTVPLREPMSQSRGPKSYLKNLLARLMRPGLNPLLDRVANIETRMNNQAMRLQAINVRTDQWSKTIQALPERLDQLDSALEHVSGVQLSREKYQGELSYWRWLIKTEQGRASLYAPFEVAFYRWQRDRLRELAVTLNLVPQDPLHNGNGNKSQLEAALNQWCAGQSVVEIGAGPYPAVAAAPAWRRAVAIDPLAKSYAEEGLLPAAAGHITYIEAPGERVPLPPGCADLVIIENALDHVNDPDAVVAEARRLLRHGGLLWLLVDLSTHTDHLHPHCFDDAAVRALLSRTGLEIITERVSGHKSHPKAYGEFRALARKPDEEFVPQAPVLTVETKPLRSSVPERA